jgi:hypothetical protein
MVAVSTVIESLRMPRVEDVVAAGDDSMSEVCAAVGMIACVCKRRMYESISLW